MKALTIWEPWASLIMAGAKPWEWRGPRSPLMFRHAVGKRIAIHAGAREVRQSELISLVEDIDAGTSSLIAEIARPIIERAIHRRVVWPRSSVLGTAILGQPISAEEWARQYLVTGIDSDRIDHHKFAWPLTDIERFEPPIPARGLQGLWEWRAP